jgi:hypothetical protein
MEQAAPASTGTPQAARPEATITIPSSQPPNQTPDAQPAAAPPPSAQPVAPAPPAVSTTPLDQLEPAPDVRPFEMPAIAPAGPVPYAALNKEMKAPVKVEDYHRSYEGPQDAVEASYDAGVRGAFAAEQALHGRLDGLWIVTATDGAPLLSLVISDPGGAGSQLGGAWRDLSRGPGPDASGLIEQLFRDGEGVVVRIRLSDAAPALTMHLTPSADGRWRGQLIEAGKPRPVVMERKAL